MKASQFYTGLAADLYDRLASERAPADDYIPPSARQRAEAEALKRIRRVRRPLGA